MATVNLDTSARLDIICRRGDTFNLTVDFGQDFETFQTADTWSMNVRDTDTSDDSILVAASDSNFEVSGPQLTIRITHSQMQAIVGDIYVYDLQTEWIDSFGVTQVRTWLHGTFTVVEDVTD